MGSIIIVVFQPVVQILLQFVEAAIQLLPEGHLVELLQDRLVEALADAIGLRRLRLRFGVRRSTYSM